MALDKAAKAVWLATVPLFEGCAGEVVADVAEVTTEQAFADGEIIVRQGQVGNGLCIVVSGAVRVVAGSQEVARLGPGDHFGELSVIDQQPRGASVVADGPTVCLALASWDLMPLLRAQPALALNMLRGLAGRLRRADAQLRD
jgi:CRP-like cAMP-binding protein